MEAYCSLGLEISHFIIVCFLLFMFAVETRRGFCEKLRNLWLRSWQPREKDLRGEEELKNRNSFLFSEYDVNCSDGDVMPHCQEMTVYSFNTLTLRPISMKFGLDSNTFYSNAMKNKLNQSVP